MTEFWTEVCITGTTAFAHSQNSDLLVSDDLLSENYTLVQIGVTITLYR